MSDILCTVCELPVNINLRYGAQRRVTGWEELRKEGGANKIVDRVLTGEWRHTACSYEVPGQESLWED